MGKTAVQRALWIGAVAGVLYAGGFLAVSPALAYTTKSPEVRDMVDRALGFLESAEHDSPGGTALIGMAFRKNKATEKHPKVAEAFEKVRSAVREKDLSKDKDPIYNMGISLVFLAGCDENVARREIEILVNTLLKVQKKCGGWGYPELETGDSSMTQYAVLGLWEVNHKEIGLKVPTTAVDRVAEWLMRTQDPSGAWGYQGRVSTTGQLVQQSEIRHTMVAASLGSAYICNDLLGFTPEHNSSGRPSALKEVGAASADGRPKEVIPTRISRDRLREAQVRGDGWFKTNFTPSPPHYSHYYLYAFERCQSFKELFEGKENLDPATTPGPPWYNAGVDYLRKTQGKDGSWESGCGKPVDTALATLFLLRSAKQSIAEAKLGAGVLVATTGLPDNPDFAVSENGRVVVKHKLSPGESLADALDDINVDSGKLLAAAELLEKGMGGKKSELLISKYEKRLKAILNDPSPEKRLAGIIVLGRGGNLDNAPLLIKALEDKDLGVVRAARDALMRLSRKFEGYGPSDDPSEIECRQAADRWRAWYLSIRPDAEF